MQKKSVITSQSSPNHQLDNLFPTMARKGSYFSGLFALTTTYLLITSSCAPLRAPELFVGAKMLEIVMNKSLPFDSSVTEEVNAD